jgi:hypothetical protein
MKKIIFRDCSLILLILATFLYSCASPLKRDLLGKSPPQFQGDVTPIQEPIQPMYRPGSMKIKLSSIHWVKSSLRDWAEFKRKNKIIKDDMLALGYSREQVDTLLRSLFHGATSKEEFEEITYEIVFIGDSLLAETEDLLTCDTKITKIQIGSKEIALDRPLLDLNILMDRYGSIEFFDLSLPALAEVDVRAEMTEEEYERIVEVTKHVTTVFKPLPMTPVGTGDVLFKSDPKELIDILVKEVPESNWLYESKGAISLDHIVKGWAYLKEKKVILTTIHYANTFYMSQADDQVTIEVTGYSLLDSSTFQLLHQRQLSSFEFASDVIGRLVLKSLILYEAQDGTQN